MFRWGHLIREITRVSFVFLDDGEYVSLSKALLGADTEAADSCHNHTVWILALKKEYILYAYSQFSE